MHKSAICNMQSRLTVFAEESLYPNHQLVIVFWPILLPLNDDIISEQPPFSIQAKYKSRILKTQDPINLPTKTLKTR